jgi:hypothetical protein
MAREGRRLRGWLLRLLLKRWVAISAGMFLLTPALILLANDYRWESPVTDGLGLIAGATGLAWILAGISGRRPDWIDTEN